MKLHLYTVDPQDLFWIDLYSDKGRRGAALMALDPGMHAVPKGGAPPHVPETIVVRFVDLRSHPFGKMNPGEQNGRIVEKLGGEVEAAGICRTGVHYNVFRIAGLLDLLGWCWSRAEIQQLLVPGDVQHDTTNITIRHPTPAQTQPPQQPQ
jgi:hypothetical protein